MFGPQNLYNSRGLHRFRFLALTALAALALAACGGSDPAAPEVDVPDVSGDWNGQAEDTFGDLQTVRLQLNQNGTRLSGTISSMIFRNLVGYSVTGSVTESGRVTIEVLAADQGGCFDVEATMTLSTSGRRLPGTYVINRKAAGCGRMPAGTPPARPFTVEGGRGTVGQP